MASNLVTRQYYGSSNVCYNSDGSAYRCNSSWYDWGRWVALGAIVVGAILIFFLFSFLSSRRRRRAGRQPMYGTGWSQFGHGQAQYNPNYQASQAAPPPAYNQDHGGYYGQNQGYFGGRQTDVELQPPQNTYGGGDGFAPPSGPPPAKK